MDRAALRMVCSPQFWRMAILWTLSLLHSYLLVFLRGRTAIPRRRRPRTGAGGEGRRPICVVTGATSGLGKAAAAALAREGYHVVLAGRCMQLLSEAVEKIQRQQSDAYLEAFQLDLSSYRSIKKFESSLKQWILETNSEPAIQLLVNNAGILAKSHRITEDGLDEMIQTNYIGPFILTNILVPLLKNSPVPSRVVNLTSFTHRCVSGIDVSEGALRGMKLGQCSAGKSYHLASSYEYTKLCLLLFSYELHQQLHISSAVSVMAADPGAVETNIMRELPPCLSWFAFSVLRFLNLLQQTDSGVGAVLDAALAPAEASGEYFFGGKGRTIRSSRLSYDTEVAKKLWAESSALFKELQLRGRDLGTN
ncbi:short-chain dehydrogenase TIC 32, chloroplastic-like isoform X2 [Phragmites australis]|uniref:short-chain dehydrogenase TIC 32, chloroplastic-like isoform X2 n=1 Tax=Phragmites australis TaxID=29695 RepID=UPI002D773F42|nr:short-chain dehydrogenase TIC 32, chloroplastic-like isoform X2 [Phragmites australis]